MTSVDVYLPIESTDDDEWIPALSIPHADIERLTFRPLKWLRFAIFAVCGAKGHLSTTPGGNTVDYENVLFDNLGDEYYYTPDGNYHFVDCKALDDRDTDSLSSVCSRDVGDFQEAVRRRDHKCIFTGDIDGRAAHIVPGIKGDEYITFVVQDRFELYERLPFSRNSVVSIDAAENGMLLSPNLHTKFARAEIAFLRTPNFAMVPTDVPSLEQGSPSDRTTLQWMAVPEAARAIRNPVLQWDSLPDWRNEVNSPPSILLDYMYGAAVVRQWKTDRLLDMLEKRFERSFGKLQVKEQKAPDSNAKHVPRKVKRKGRKKSSQDASEGMLEAMDNVLILSMLLKGTTPQSLAAQRKKQYEEAAQRSQERSREKVRQWQGDTFASG